MASASGSVGAPVGGTYGSITIAAGGGYTYTLNNALPAVQGLDSGQTVTETFTYTITDGDGDTSTTTVTITINGANDAPTVTVPRGAPGTRWTKRGLRRGRAAGRSNSAATRRPTAGTLTYTNGDGASTVTINGRDGAGGGCYGDGRLWHADRSPRVDRATHAITYSYTLADNVDNDTDADAVRDLHGGGLRTRRQSSDDASATFQITIADDVPTAVHDVDSVTEDGPLMADGNVLTGSGGADRQRDRRCC